MKATYIHHSLSDRDVANFARQSFGKTADEFTDEQNHNLIKYLARGMPSKEWGALLNQMDGSAADTEEGRHGLAVYLRSIPEHWVPFGHPTISIRMQAPVPIARQLFKHKIGFVESEESRRYISSTPELYIPETFREAAANVKQGSAGEHKHSGYYKTEYMTVCNRAIDLYEAMIRDGICPEQARFVLPQGCEVNWVWTGSLYAYANMYNQRADSHAQKETQNLAAEIDQIIAPLYPVSWAALTSGEY